MLFRRLIYCSILVGLCAGVANSGIQQLQVVPIIAAAEVFESMLPPETTAIPQHEPGNDAHTHDAAAWEPRNGFERSAWILLSNVLSATGFALLMIPIMVYWARRHGGNVTTVGGGLVWGGVGWFCVFAWPALGLSPELPGEAAAALPLRQAWWLLAVICAASGLVLIAIVTAKWRWLGVPLLALPFLIGAPHIDGAVFSQHSADAVTQLEQLKLRFIIATALASVAHWLVLGVGSAMVIRRWLWPLLLDSGNDIDPLLPSSTHKMNS